MIIESLKKKNLILNLRNFNLWIIIIKRMHTAKQIPSIIFNAVKEKKLFDLA